MLKTFSAALVAASMIAAPVFAASPAPTANKTAAPMTASVPAKTAIDNKAGLTAKAAADTKAVNATTGVKTKATVKSGKKLHKKHIKMTRRHGSKAVKHVRHASKSIKHKSGHKVALKMPSAKKSTVRSGS
jgi:hypothetical protein